MSNEVTPNTYLDARRPEWRDAELYGAVRYDPVRRVVVIHQDNLYRTVVEQRP